MLDFTMHPQLGAIAATLVSTGIVHDIVEALLHLALFDSRLLDAYKLHPFAVESLLEERHPSARQLTPRTQTVRRITNDLTSRARLKCVDIRSGHLKLMQRNSGFHFASRVTTGIHRKIMLLAVSRTAIDEFKAAYALVSHARMAKREGSAR